MLCYHSSNKEWPLLSQISATLQSTEDAVHEAVSQGSWKESWMPQSGSQIDTVTSHVATTESTKRFWVQAKSVSKCLELQFEHQCAYQMFYQNLKDFEGTLEASFSSVRERLQRLGTTGSIEEANVLLENTQKLITQVLLWWRRTDSMVSQSRRVLPMRARLEPIEFKRPAHLLVDYVAPEAKVSANDEVFVVDATNRDQWIIETANGDRVNVPSLCVAISGPDPNAIERALSLRLLLLANWTIALKELGKGLISLMLAIFRQLNNNEVDSLKDISPETEDLQPLLTTMEQLLQSYWSDHPEFEELRQRMHKARVSLAVCGTEDSIDDSTHIDINTIFLRMSPLVMGSSDPTSDTDAALMRQTLSLLIGKYQELTRYWEAYKLMTEASTDPNYFWMMEEFQQLRRVNLSELLEFMSNGDKENCWADLLQLLAARKSSEAAVASPPAAKLQTRDTDSNFIGNGHHASKTADQPQQGKQPEVKVRERVAAYEDRVQSQTSAASSSDDAFLPADQDDLTARRQQQRFPFVRRGSAASSMMSSRCSNCSTSTVGRSTEVQDYKREETEHKSKLVISCVVDTQEKTVVSLKEAIRRGIINWGTGSYLNRADNTWIPIQAALSKGLIIAESRTEGRTKVTQRRVYGLVTVRIQRPQQPQLVASVLDRSRDRRWAPAEAQARGLADRTLTKFLDTQTGEWLNAVEASSRGVIDLSMAGSVMPSEGGEATTEESYMIYSALDVAKGAPLSFQRAKEKGVIDAEEGVFWNSQTGEALELDVAIRKGFVRARRVANSNETCGGGASSAQPLAPSMEADAIAEAAVA